MPNSNGAWKETLKRNWANTRLAHEAGMLGELMAEKALVRRLVKKSQDGTVGTPTEEDEDVDVNVGNEIHYHVAQTAADAQPTSTPITSTASAWLAPLLSAALAAAGAGGLTYLMTRDIPTMVDTDTDTQYELRLGTGE